MKDADLWTRLTACHPDAVEADFPFSGRLARDNGWSRAYALRVIGEYQRFAYLCMLNTGMKTPSDEVDQAWHLHLTYTRHYWGPFREALGAPLHHMPTKGGPDQAALFRAAYEDTLLLYEREFGAPPPQDIWPPTEIRFGKAPYFKRVNGADVWLVPKPRCAVLLAKLSRKLAALPKRAPRLVTASAAVFLGTSLAFAHGEPAGDTPLEKLRNMVWHWALEHTFWFIAGVVITVAALAVLLNKASGGKSSGCGSGCSSGCSGGGGSGGSGCGGCGD